MVEDGRLERYKLETSTPIVNEGGGGLLGSALSADVRESGIAYFYYSYRGPSGLANKVIRARFDGTSWRETDVLIEGIPGHRLYNGGRIAIGPDGHLYVTTGWTENRELPQDLRSLSGKILRMSLDGRVPGDNPFRGSYVYSYGHRNPQGLDWNDAGELFVAEHASPPGTKSTSSARAPTMVGHCCLEMRSGKAWRRPSWTLVARRGLHLASPLQEQHSS